MFTRFRIAFGLALVLSLLSALPAFAGGWAVITLDELPMDVVVGEPLTVGFMVLQHGKTPVDGLEPTVTASLYKEEWFDVVAEPGGKPGHYTATLTFPKEGDWTWSIQAFGMDHLMPMLSVAAPVAGVPKQPVVKNEPAFAVVSPFLIVRVAVLGMGLFGLAFAFRRKSRLAMALTAVCLLFGVGSFLAVPVVPAVGAQSQSSPEVLGDSSASQVELGRQLFVAKGCITCHANNKVVRAAEYWVIDAGPNLTDYSASPEVLRVRLKDPASAKSDTKMPNLNLSEFEIEALIAFINSD